MFYNINSVAFFVSDAVWLLLLLLLSVVVVILLFEFTDDVVVDDNAIIQEVRNLQNKFS